jgi:hypothetical protein
MDEEAQESKGKEPKKNEPPDLPELKTPWRFWIRAM